MSCTPTSSQTETNLPSEGREFHSSRCSCLRPQSLLSSVLQCHEQLLISISLLPHRVSSSAMSLLIELHHRFSQKLKSRAEELRGGTTQWLHRLPLIALSRLTDTKVIVLPWSSCILPGSLVSTCLSKIQQALPALSGKDPATQTQVGS